MPRALVIRLQNRSPWHFSDSILQMRLILTRGLSTLSLSTKCSKRRDTLHTAALPTAPEGPCCRRLGATDRVGPPGLVPSQTSLHSRFTWNFCCHSAHSSRVAAHRASMPRQPQWPARSDSPCTLNDEHTTGGLSRPSAQVMRPHHRCVLKVQTRLSDSERTLLERPRTPLCVRIPLFHVKRANHLRCRTTATDVLE